MGTDHFLGEIAVPLREVEEVDGDLKKADIRRYTLGRRSAKDKVRLLEQPVMLLTASGPKSSGIFIHVLQIAEESANSASKSKTWHLVVQLMTELVSCLQNAKLL